MLESPVSILLTILSICVGWLLRDVHYPKWLLITLLCAEILVVALMGTFAWSWLKIPLVVVSFPLMLISFAVSFRLFKQKKGVSALSHLGIAVVFCAAMCGNADTERGQVILFQDKPVMQAYTADGRIMPIPFTVELKRFETDYYPGGSQPKMFRSRLRVNGENLTTEVNAPAHYRDYALFQSGYDPINNAYSVIEVVRDPWLPVVFIGMAMLMIGAVLSIARCWHSWKAWIVILLLALLFAFASLIRINFDTLMPALRNWLFVPHLLVYMLAYAVVAIVLVLSFLPNFRPYISPLMTTASNLLVIGMIFGAIWARMAWGDYWTWDAKECWAAVTWMASLAYIHLPKMQHKVRMWFVILTFAALQMTWYGVNYLPASRASMHTYNK